MPSRQDVYAVIDGERLYQDKRWNAQTTTSNGLHTFEEWIVYIEDYLAEAKHVLSRKAAQHAQPEAADIMRKVAALAVACMEQNGAKPRDGYEHMVTESSDKVSVSFNIQPTVYLKQPGDTCDINIDGNLIAKVRWEK